MPSRRTISPSSARRRPPATEIRHTGELKNDPTGIKKITVGVVGNNLLNDDIHNHVSYTKDQVLMPGARVRAFASVKY
jgi:iron complex outermembrane receptor protein